MITAISAACQMDLSCVGTTHKTFTALPDMHCPELPGGLNFWASSCFHKTNDALGACCRKGCKVGDIIRAQRGLGPVVAKSRCSEDEREAAKVARRAERILQESLAAGQCACGKPSLRKQYIEKLAKYGASGPHCAACAKRVRDKFFYQRKLAELGGGQ